MAVVCCNTVQLVAREGADRRIYMSETKDSSAELNEGVISIQKAYDHRMAQLEESISALKGQHAEWLNLNNGEKLLRLKLVAAFEKNSEVESVYSEKVKLRAKEIKAHFDQRAEKALKELQGMTW